MCCYDCELFGVESFEDHCAIVYEELKAFCAQNSLQLHMLALTRQLLGFAKSSEFPAGRLVNKYRFVFVCFPQDLFLCCEYFSIFPTQKVWSEELVQRQWHSIIATISWKGPPREVCRSGFGWRWNENIVSSDFCGRESGKPLYANHVPCCSLALCRGKAYFDWVRPSLHTGIQDMCWDLLLERSHPVQISAQIAYVWRSALRDWISGETWSSFS